MFATVYERTARKCSTAIKYKSGKNMEHNLTVNSFFTKIQVYMLKQTCLLVT